MIRICKDAGWLDDGVKRAIRHICNQCDVCARSGVPMPFKKVSLNYVNQAFNDEVQSDFTFVKIQIKNYTVIHYVDTGTGYSEGVIVHERKGATLINKFDKVWIFRHGAPNFMSSDDEFDRCSITSALNKRGVAFKPRLYRRHNKVGIVELKMGRLRE